MGPDGDEKSPHGDREPFDDSSPPDRPWTRLVGLGMELSGTTLGLAGIGYLVDRHWLRGDGLGVAIGAFVGFAFGMFRFIQKAMREVNRDSHKP